jgi:undecaprenyl-diphosphatase
MTSSILAWDAAIRAWLVSHHAPLLDPLMLGLSVIGRRGSIWLAVGLGLVLARPRTLPALWQLVLAISLAGLVTDFVIKPAVARPRPFAGVSDVRVLGARPETYSFPSGHAATACAGAAMLGRMWPDIRRLSWVLALLIGFSRIYLGVHYPIDVLGGAAIGLLSSLVVSAWGPVPAIVPIAPDSSGRKAT